MWALRAHSPLSIQYVLLPRELWAGTLHAVTICSRAAATAADSKDSASFFTDHMLAPHAQAEALNDYRQSSVLWFFDESGQPPLHGSGSMVRTHYSVKENTHLHAGTER